jgi:hypothetical protein
MERYAIRALKFTIFFYVFVSLMMILLYFFEGGQDISVHSFVQQAGLYRMLIIGLAFGLSYPFIGFGKRKVYLNRTFEQEKSAIVDIMAQYGYEQTYETGTSIFFRPTNRLKRFIDQYEDTIEVAHHDNPIVVKGLRKRIVRVGIAIEGYIMNEKR